MRSIISFLCLSFLLAACTQSAPPELAPLSFKDQSAIPLDVYHIEVINEYESPMQLPNVEDEADPTPEAVLKQWADERLEAAGETGWLEFIIHQASITETPLPPTKTGMTGVFTKEAAARYNADIEVEARIYTTQQHLAEAHVNVVISREAFLMEGASLYEKQQLWRNMLRDIMQDFDKEMQRQIDRYFARYRIGKQ